VLTALALIPEVISFSVIAGVDPKVSLIASVVLCLAMSVLGGARRWSPRPPGRWRW
jgi:SulP family sulfate permease